MWLINTSTLKLEYFINPQSDGIRYAILSHTWEKDEVSFQDISRPETAQRKAGYTKITKTCELARTHGLDYAWVDTCCIDKSSSAELSEAINSMYQWYRESTICFAFLCDLSNQLPEQLLNISTQLQGLWATYNVVPEDRARHTAFSRCRWFTRGWTLQELIAPKELVFFDASWAPMGSKTDLCHLVVSLTGISASVLQGADLLSLPVQERMVWASKRETTRVEDMAYCLLGLFDVNLPLIYGEGLKAFQRLQGEIARRTGDPTLLAWTPDTESRVASQRHPPLDVNHPGMRFSRSALAWTPAEFAPRQDPRRPGLVPLWADSSGWDIVPGSTSSRIEINADSSAVLHFARILLTLTGDVFLELPAVQPFYRSIDRAPSGEYVFTRQRDPGDVSLGSKSALTNVITVPALRLAGQRAAEAMRTEQHLTIELFTRFDGDVDSVSSGAAIQDLWPEHQWDEIKELFFDSQARSHKGYFFDLVGISRFRVLIPQETGRDMLLDRNLDIVSCVGLHSPRARGAAALALPAPVKVWGLTFVRQSKDQLSVKVHGLLDKVGKSRFSYRQDRVLYSDIQDLIIKARADISPGRYEEVLLKNFMGLSRKFRVSTVYSDNTLKDTASFDKLSCMANICLAREERPTVWTRCRWDTAQWLRDEDLKPDASKMYWDASKAHDTAQLGATRS